MAFAYVQFYKNLFYDSGGKDGPQECEEYGRVISQMGFLAGHLLKQVEKEEGKNYDLARLTLMYNREAFRFSKHENEHYQERLNCYLSSLTMCLSRAGFANDDELILHYAPELIEYGDAERVEYWAIMHKIMVISYLRKNYQTYLKYAPKYLKEFPDEMKAAQGNYGRK